MHKAVVPSTEEFTKTINYKGNATQYLVRCNRDPLDNATVLYFRRHSYVVKVKVNLSLYLTKYHTLKLRAG
jgi:hypothetical protein